MSWLKPRTLRTNFVMSIKITYHNRVSNVIAKKVFGDGTFLYVLDVDLFGNHQIHCDVEIEDGEYEEYEISYDGWQYFLENKSHTYKITSSTHSLLLHQIFVETHAKLQAANAKIVELEKDLELFASTKQFIQDSEKLANFDL